MDLRRFNIGEGLKRDANVDALTQSLTKLNVMCAESGRARIRDMMRQASGSGLNMIRTWAHTNHKKFPFQVFQKTQMATLLRPLSQFAPCWLSAIE